MQVLVFSDPHGRIPLLLRIVGEARRRLDVAFDLILVAGDLGVWPDPLALDSSTRRCARADPGELGFLHFAPLGDGTVSGVPGGGLRDPAEVDALVRSFCTAAGVDSGDHLRSIRRERELLDGLLPELRCPVLFVGGNHEDYDYLLRCRDLAHGQESCPVEGTGMLSWIPSGRTVRRGLSVAGLSGLDAAAAGRSPARYHEAIRIDDDRTLSFLEQAASGPVDVLLSHDGPPGFPKDGKGSDRILLAVSELDPLFHVFGHYHASRAPALYRELYPELSTCRTRAIHLNKLAFLPGGALRERAVGLLRWSDAVPSFELLDAPWLRALTAQSWHRLTL